MTLLILTSNLDFRSTFADLLDTAKRFFTKETSSGVSETCNMI